MPQLQQVYVAGRSLLLVTGFVAEWYWWIPTGQPWKLPSLFYEIGSSFTQSSSTGVCFWNLHLHMQNQNVTMDLYIPNVKLRFFFPFAGVTGFCYLNRKSHSLQNTEGSGKWEKFIEKVGCNEKHAKTYHKSINTCTRVFNLRNLILETVLECWERLYSMTCSRSMPDDR